MEKTLSQLIAEMDRIEALSEQLTQRDKSQITQLYNQYKGKIQPNLQALAARVYDAAINDKPLSSNDLSQARQVYNQVMPQIPAPIKTMYSGIINRGLDQLNKSGGTAAPAQEPAQQPAAQQPAAQQPAQASAAQQPAQASAAQQPASAAPVRGGTLRRGSRGDAVVDLQNKLGIEADGQYGPATAAAVEKFQQENGLDVDGVVGPATLAALNSESPTQQPAQEPAQAQAQEPAASADNTAQQSSGPDDGSRAGQEPNREPATATPAASQPSQSASAEDADEIERLMAMPARSPSDEAQLAMLARKYDFYGKPENIGPAIEKIRAAAGRSKTSRTNGNFPTSEPVTYTTKNFPSMNAAMQKVDYYQPGEKVNIDGQPHVRDVSNNGEKIFRPTSNESVELNRIKGLAGL